MLIEQGRSRSHGTLFACDDGGTPSGKNSDASFSMYLVCGLLELDDIFGAREFYPKEVGELAFVFDVPLALKAFHERMVDGVFVAL